MANLLARGWKYMMLSFDKKTEDNTDPRVQVAQAVKTEHQRHQEVQRQVVAIIGNRNQLEMQLRRLTSEHDKVTENTRQALADADQARAKSDKTIAWKMESTAEVSATQLVNIEKELENTTQLHQQAISTAEETQRQAQQSQARYEQIRQDTRKPEPQADQAKIQETVSKILQSMQGTPEDPNVLTLDSVHEKIEDRHANVLGAQELAEPSQAGHMAEIKTSTHDAIAGMRLVEIRAQMNNESAALEPGSAAEDNAGELGSAESAESAEVVKDTTTNTDEAKQSSPAVNSHQQESVGVYGSLNGKSHRQGQVAIVS